MGDDNVSAWVVDCSAFMPLVLGDESPDVIESLLQRVVSGHNRIVVPPLFWYEVTNVLQMASVRKRLSSGYAEGALYRFTELPIVTDDDLSPSVVLRINRFASEYDLTAYDAAYFELAERHCACLLTFDKGLLKLAATHSWIRCRVD